MGYHFKLIGSRRDLDPADGTEGVAAPAVELAAVAAGFDAAQVVAAAADGLACYLVVADLERPFGDGILYCLAYEAVVDHSWHPEESCGQQCQRLACLDYHN